MWPCTSRCPKGIYHVDFEICELYSDEDYRLHLTDYCNRSEAFYNYFNGDLGEVSFKECCCGRQTNCLDKFIGRETETFTLGDKKIYGMEIYDTLFPGLAFDDSLLKQDADGDICFYYNIIDKRKLNYNLEKVNEKLTFLFGDGNYMLEESSDLSILRGDQDLRKKRNCG